MTSPVALFALARLLRRAAAWADRDDRAKKYAFEEGRAAPRIDPESPSVVGTIEAVSTVIAPASGRACVWFEVLIQRGTNDDAEWETVASETGGTPFRFVDGAAEPAIFDPGDAAVVDARQQVIHGGGALRASQAALLARHGLVAGSSLELRYLECALLPSDRIKLFGHVTAERDLADPTLGYRDRPPVRIRARTALETLAIRVLQ